MLDQRRRCWADDVQMLYLFLIGLFSEPPGALNPSRIHCGVWILSVILFCCFDGLWIVYLGVCVFSWCFVCFVSESYLSVIYKCWCECVTWFVNCHLLTDAVTKIKWNESGFRPPLCTYRLNWARRTSWGWWDDWDDTVLQTQDSKFEPWWSEAEHATSRSRRLPTKITFTRGPTRWHVGEWQRVAVTGQR